MPTIQIVRIVLLGVAAALFFLEAVASPKPKINKTAGAWCCITVTALTYVL